MVINFRILLVEARDKLVCFRAYFDVNRTNTYATAMLLLRELFPSRLLLVHFIPIFQSYNFSRHFFDKEKEASVSMETREDDDQKTKRE